MGFSVNSPRSEISGEYLSIRSTAEISGYNQQYLRRLSRNRVFQSRKIGQIWLIDKKSFLDYLKSANKSKDKRFGPQYCVQIKFMPNMIAKRN